MSKNKRILITIAEEDYDYMKWHWIKISPICNEAIRKYIDEFKAQLDALKKEIPANVDKKVTL